MSEIEFNQYVTHKATKPSCASDSKAPIEIKLAIQENEKVNGKDSYIHFNISFTRGAAGTNAVIETGSIANIFQRCTIIARDGQTIDVLDNLNQYSAYTQAFTKSRSYRDSQANISAVDGSIIPKDTYYSFAIPLGDVINLFNHGDLLPSVLLDGMRIRFDLADSNDVCLDSFVQDVPVVYIVRDFKIVLDTYVSHNEKSQEPQVIDFETYIHKGQDFLAGSSNVQAVMPAHFTCSKAIRAIAVATSTPSNNQERLEWDYIGTGDAIATETVRWRIGNRFVPATELTTNDEQYYHTLKAFNGIGNSLGCAITSAEFNNKYKVHAVDLRRQFRSSELNGTPSDNNNVIEFNWKKEVDANHTVNLFIVYIRRLVLHKGHISVLL